MKILIVHNEYGKYSGEEAVVDKMVGMLQGLGHEVAQLRMSTAGARESLLGKMHGFAAGVYSPRGVRAMRDALRRHRPDVVNVHNVYPFISPVALRECRKAGVPVVMTIHNFRLMCPTGLFLRNDRPCERCLQRGNEWGCVRYNCEHSRLKSLGYALRGAAARWRGDFRECVDVFACITDFQRRKLIEAGFDPSRIVVIPNSMELAPAAGTGEQPAPLSPHCVQTTLLTQTAPYVAYSGRISREKGVDMIMEAARQLPQVQFRLAGAVRDEELVSDLPPNVRLMGYLSGEALERFYREAQFFVMASRWYEGFPMTILEAARYAKPMVAPDHGGFTEIVGSGAEAIGVLTAPNQQAPLTEAIASLWADPQRCAALGAAAQRKFRDEYATDVIAQKWQQLLQKYK